MSLFDLIQYFSCFEEQFPIQLLYWKGGFGKVWRVERKKSRAQYAMKEMSKARIITKRSVKSVINER